jgi:C-terminal processing protease CtpA/Prc
LTDSVRREAAKSANLAECTSTLKSWVAFFRDPHLQVDLTRSQSQKVDTADERAAAAAAEARRRPALTYLDDSTALLYLGDFGDRYKPAIDSVIAAHRARLLRTPYMVIDVRRNGGGWTGSYESVLPLLYTDPIVIHGMEVWASEGNTAYLRAMLESSRAEGIKRTIRPLIPLMEASPNEFVTINDSRTVRMDSVHPMPHSVAILIGRGCISTCEQFVLDARQSRKVTILGTGNTGGFIDYGNARSVVLPSGIRAVYVPSSRSKRLPGLALDMIGIAPSVLVPVDTPDVVGFARRLLVQRRR